MGGWVAGWLRIDYNANSVQLLLQLPTGTELGNVIIGQHAERKHALKSI